MSDRIPKAVEAKLHGTSCKYALIVFLDSRDAFIDFSCPTHAAFLVELRDWKRNTWPSLSRSDCRLFIKEPGAIKELHINA